MQIPSYDPARARWDEFHRFHNKDRYWISVFESGEMLLEYTEIKPHTRERKAPNVAVGCSLRMVATIDPHCPRMMLAKESLTDDVMEAFDTANVDPKKYLEAPLPASWLAGAGKQTLAVDEDNGRTIRFAAVRSAGAPQCSSGWEFAPRWVNGVSGRAIYVPGPSAPAIGTKVHVSITSTQTKGERSTREKLKEHARAWVEICNGDVHNHAPRYYRFDANGAFAYNRPMRFAELPKGLDTELTDLSPERIFQLAWHGFAPAHVGVLVEALTAKLD